MKNILVGIDLNEKTKELIEKAQELAKKENAKLWLLHVNSPLPEYVGIDYIPPSSSSNVVETMKETRRKRLTQYVNELKAQGLEVEGIFLEGPATSQILNESEKLNVDLIICGHHEHSILYNMLFGSVSASVVRNSHIPVLVYPLK